MKFGDRIYKYSKDGIGTWYLHVATLIPGTQSTWSVRYDDGDVDPIWSLDDWCMTEKQALREATKHLQAEIDLISNARRIA